jgi:hypothetical protein
VIFRKITEDWGADKEDISVTSRQTVENIEAREDISMTSRPTV